MAESPYPYDSRIQLWYAASLTASAPSLATVNAGTNLTPFLMTGGPELDGNVINFGTAASRFTRSVAGSYGGNKMSVELLRHRVYADDNAFVLLTRGLLGYLVWSMRGPATGSTLAIGDRVDVYQIEVITRNPAPYARDQVSRFTADFAVHAVPVEDVALLT